MGDVGLETRERVSSQEEEINRCLGLAADYLAAIIASKWKPESQEDLQMRKAGARLQQRLATFVLRNYHHRDPQGAEVLEMRMRRFWEGYHLLVLKPLEKEGYNIEQLRQRKPDTGMEYVISLKQGVWGAVATSTLALRSGWQVEFPSAEEDVRSGIDLFIEKEGQRIPLQIKCRQEASSIGVRKERSGLMLRVTIPAKRTFFKHPELGIPDPTNITIFKRHLESQLAK